MNYAAMEAGMTHCQLGLEPIVATFYVLNNPKTEIDIEKGKNLVILDCGGGTVGKFYIYISPSLNQLPRKGTRRCQMLHKLNVI